MNTIGAGLRACAMLAAKLFGALIFLVLGITFFAIRNIHEEQWSVRLLVDDWLDQFFGPSVA
jgi:uncharacterized membrane protein SirB2